MTWRLVEAQARTSSVMLRKPDSADGTLWLLVLSGAALAFAAIFLL